MKQNPTPRIMNLFMLIIRRFIWKWRYSFRCHGWLFKKVKINNLFCGQSYERTSS